jgi:toxin FitB
VLIDTNVWSELSKGQPDPSVIGFVASNCERSVLSTIVIAEMRFGVARVKDSARHARLNDWLDDLLEKYTDRLLPFDLDAAITYGDLKARLSATGTPIAELDLLIAAQAVAANIPLVTRNVADMARTGATIINPWQS